MSTWWCLGSSRAQRSCIRKQHAADVTRQRAVKGRSSSAGVLKKIYDETLKWCLNSSPSFPSKHCVQVEKGNKHTAEVGDTALASVFTAAWLCVFTVRASVLQAAAQKPSLALRTQRLTMRNWRFNNLYWRCPSLIAATWWEGDEKCHLKMNEVRCDPRFCNIFYQWAAAAHGQNPGSGRGTAANANVAVTTPWVLRNNRRAMVGGKFKKK